MFKQKVLVTGGAGFIGSHQVDALIEAGYKVVVVDDLSSGKESNLNKKAEFYKIDIRDDEELEKVFKKEKPESVIHFAAQISVSRSVEDPLYDADINVLGTLNLLENCIKYKVKKIVFASTGGALYGEADKVPTSEDYPIAPSFPYGIAKFSVENYLRFYHEEFGLPYTVNRYANVYGPRQDSQGEAGVVAIFTEKLLNNKQPIIHGDGHQTRDFVFVEDVVFANMLALEHDKVGTYNVGTGRQTTINELYYLIAEAVGVKIQPKYEKVFFGQKVSCLNAEKIKNELKWHPEYTLQEGVEATVDWFKKSKLQH